MGRRFGRKKILKWKKEQANPNNGYFWCGAKLSHISHDVCLVQQTRSSSRCHGCEHHKEDAA